MSSGADRHAVIDRINEVVLRTPGISGPELLARVDHHLLDLAADPDNALNAYAGAAAYCCIDEWGRWWPTKPISSLGSGDRVKSDPSRRQALDSDPWLEVATVSAPDDLGRVSVTFTLLDGFIHAEWNRLSPDYKAVFLPGPRSR